METNMNMMSAMPNQMSTNFADLLPVEVSQMILRHLDGDPQLRQTAQNVIREERRAQLKRGITPNDSTSEIATKYRLTSDTTAVAVFLDYSVELRSNPPVQPDLGLRKILVPKRRKI
ncbi:hypothetical protein PV328_000354 [Microctonus aethiopoides]|uniref:Uncharacterized protein n=1 Tax=Microctonus aethiopoides TaxID=144406 RepID=A0AA39FV60_9HYME|nr:hypothetical protein PV328_000354 [Microctonus aethiopoides]